MNINNTHICDNKTANFMFEAQKLNTINKFHYDVLKQIFNEFFSEKEKTKYLLRFYEFGSDSIVKCYNIVLDFENNIYLIAFENRNITLYKNGNPIHFNNTGLDLHKLKLLFMHFPYINSSDKLMKLESILKQIINTQYGKI